MSIADVAETRRLFTCDIPVGARVYLAGPMTGVPLFNFPAFEDAAARLRRFGIRVVSPAELDLMEGFDPEDFDVDEPPMPLSDYMGRDLPEVIACDGGVVVLPGWRRSRGAKIEVSVAVGLGRPVYEYTTLLRLPVDVILT